MKYDPITPELFVQNRERLRTLLKPSSIVIVHANDVLPTNADGSMAFKQNSDLFWLTGVDQEESVLVLFPDAVEEKHREMLFLRETSEQIAVWEGEKLTKELARERTGIRNVHWLTEFESTLRGVVYNAEHIYLNTNEHARAADVVETRERRFIDECRRRYPLHRYERLAPLTSRLRMFKSRHEIDLIQKACDITQAGFERVLGFVKPGVGEWEIEAELLHEFVRRRSKGFAYTPIIGSGKNACVLHYVENHSVCQDGEMVLLDVAAEYANYNSDLTRTLPVNGRFTPRQRQVYDAVLRMFRFCSGILRPGILIKDYMKLSCAKMEEELIGLGLLKAEDLAGWDWEDPKHPRKKWFMHGISHHIGLDVHDVWHTYAPVEAGMVFTVEPGIYIREEGLGVRLENDILIGADKNIDLMANIPIEAEEIEDWMNRKG